MPAADKPVSPLSPYQRKLLLFLSVATFFEGYDYLALSQLLPNIRADLGLSRTEGGYAIGCISLGMVLSYFFVRKADQIGRRRVLSLTIVGYAIASFLTGLLPGVAAFVICQLIARMFLIGELAIAMIYAAEEFPAERRGFAIGMMQTMSSLGSITCAALVPLLLKSPWGWRGVFMSGAVPLLIVAFARRSLRETSRFAQLQSNPNKKPVADLFAILRSPYRSRVFLMALIWGLTYACMFNAQQFWKEFAVGQVGLTDAQVGKSLAVAAVFSLPLLYLLGRFLDRVGRRVGAILVYLVAVVSIIGMYTGTTHLQLTIALVGGIFGISAVLPVLNSFTTELFPTELRSDAFAWSNNLLGRISMVLSPLAIGAAAERYNWGITLSATTLFPLIALVLILRYLPETARRELEDTSSVH